MANQTSEEITDCPIITAKLQISLSQKTDEIILKKNDPFEKILKHEVEVL